MASSMPRCSCLGNISPYHTTQHSKSILEGIRKKIQPPDQLMLAAPPGSPSSECFILLLTLRAAPTSQLLWILKVHNSSGQHFTRRAWLSTCLFTIDILPSFLHGKIVWLTCDYTPWQQPCPNSIFTFSLASLPTKFTGNSYGWR